MLNWNGKGTNEDEEEEQGKRGTEMEGNRRQEEGRGEEEEGKFSLVNVYFEFQLTA